MGMIFFIASLFHGFFGFGAAIIATPLLSLFLGVKTVIPLVAIQTLFVNGYVFKSLRKYFLWNPLKPLLFSSILGLPVGIYILAYTPQKIIKIFLVFLIFLFVLFKWKSPTSSHVKHTLWHYALGFLAGALGAAFNINGPPVIMYVLSQEWSARLKKITMSSYFFLSGFMVVIFHYLSGISNNHLLYKALTLIPFTLLGSFVGTHLFEKIHARKYEKWMLILLFLLGLLLLF